MPGRRSARRTAPPVWRSFGNAGLDGGSGQRCLIASAVDQASRSPKSCRHSALAAARSFGVHGSWESFVGDDDPRRLAV